MNNSVSKILDEAILLELNIAELYLLFARKIPIDYEFWFKLALEEKNHAALLRSGKEMLRFDKFPNSLLPDSMEEFEKANAEILEFIEKFTEKPDRIYAFEISYFIEHSIGEAHYNNYMSTDSDESLRTIYKKLNKADIDHAKRIKDYWEKILAENLKKVEK